MAAPLQLLLSSLFLLLLLLLRLPSFVTASKNPFTARAAAIRYWDRKVPNGFPHPSFLLSKLSPLSAADAAAFSSIIATTPFSLSSRLATFCPAARILCSPSLNSNSPHPKDSNFTSYKNVDFTNYGTGHHGGADEFKNYSSELNLPSDSFRGYSRDSAGHSDSFQTYSPDGNLVNDNFTSYATGATAGSGDFSAYAREANGPNVRFANYETDAHGRPQSFSFYSFDTNSGSESFSGYGKRGDGVPTTFASYANGSNVIGSGFDGYGEEGVGANDTFKSYGFDGNVPRNDFRAYGESGNNGADTFMSYSDRANVGDDSFQSYAKHGNGDRAKFVNYGASFNPGSDSFKGYGEGSAGQTIEFESYARGNNTFKDYAKTGINFAEYHNKTLAPLGTSGRPVNRWAEPGKFFRENNLKEGTVMPMPDIQDKMPERSFLPRSIAEKLPFSATELSQVFRVRAGSGLGRAIAGTVDECAHAPSRGETKRCVTSAEDMIDFTVAVLGSDIAVRSTESTKGSNQAVVIGKVKGINGGKVTMSVSCHQSLFPYLVYYCHSVPKVRVYEAEILAVDSRERINRGVAICHLDTSAWGLAHDSFVALGGRPGEIEVCHWIFEGDMTWTVAD